VAKRNRCYRKIWETFHNKKIPKGYHIHHIDGNRDNNCIENLMCVSAEEHFQIHLQQGDPVALNGKFIQGASAAGKLGGKNGKGWSFSEKSKKRLSNSLKKYYKSIGCSPLFGRKCSIETIEKIRFVTTGEKNPMYGKKHSEKTKKRLSEIGKTKIGSKNSFYGKKHSEKTKKHLSEIAKNRKSPSLKKYDIFDENMNKIYSKLEKYDIMKLLNLNNRQYKSLQAFRKRTGESRIHPKMGVLIKEC